MQYQSLFMRGEFPYLTRKKFGGSELNFWICDDIARSWYDTPGAQRIQEPLPFVGERDQSVGWLEMDLLRDRIATPGSVVLDIGCHHGLTTTLLAGWVGESGFVYAFDAMLTNAYVAKENLIANSIRNATVIGVGVGRDAFLANSFNDSNVVLKASEQSNLNSTLVVPLSGLFSRRIDAAKIDIEGYELELLESHRNFFQNIPRLLVEVHTDMLPENSVHRIADCLAGRRLYVLEGEAKLSEYDEGKSYSDRLHILSW